MKRSRAPHKARKMRELTPEPLTAEAFAPFGSVIEASDEAVKLDINQGHAVRYDRLAEIDVADDGGTGAISLFRARPLDELVLKIFERHPLGSQSFVPLSGRPYLVAVAPAGDFDPAKSACSAPRATRASTTARASGTTSCSSSTPTAISSSSTAPAPATIARRSRWRPATRSGSACNREATRIDDRPFNGRNSGIINTLRSRPNDQARLKEAIMGKGILLWLLGIPLPIIILLLLIWH